ncbi:MAG TPA: ABC transporter substrate-binding protein, partial [Thermomicrobiales bacterium]|nr:ABC transporter substrate-binding protein [Thermomicrobiales bacterium]
TATTAPSASTPGGGGAATAPAEATSAGTETSGSPETGAGGTPTTGGSILIGTLGEAGTINPIAASQSEDYFRCSLIYEQLVRLDPATYEPKPSLASQWEVNDLTFTFTLHDNIMFSDGSNLTADDIAFTIQAMLDTKNASPRQSRLMSIEGAKEFADGSATEVSGVKVVDPTTIEITLAEPDASILFNMYYVRPLPKALLEGKDLSKASTDPFFQNPVGAGPFKFVSWTVGADFVGERNEHYYQEGKPYLDKFTHRTITDSQALVNSLLSGDIDGSVYPSPSGADQLKANADLEVLVPPFGSPDGWIFNFKNEYLAKKEVRQAIAYALDMEQFAKDSLYGLGAAGTGPVAPGNFVYDSSLTPHPYDMDKAKELLDQAGPPPSGIKFMVNQGNVLREDFLTLTQAQLSKLGWEIEPVVIEYATAVDQVTARSYDVAESQMVGAGITIDPGDLASYYETDGSANYAGYSNPDLDKLFDEARTTLDVEKQKDIYAQIQQILVEDLPATYSWYRPYLHVVKKKFAGYVDSNLSNGLFAELENVYIKEG